MIEYRIKVARPLKNIFTDAWVWRMALRDARHNFSRLFLFAASLITGIAAVVAIGSINYSIQRDLDKNAKELLGADLVINSSKKIDSNLLQLLDSTNTEKAFDADMASMVLFLHNQQSRLIKLTALRGNFPFYGKLETKPANAYALMKSGKFALLDESLATQYEVSTNDSIKVGNTIFKVAGVVTKIPGGGGFTSTISPSVYISMDVLDSTGLVQFGSRVGYSLYLKTKEADTQAIIDKLEPTLKKLNYTFETVKSRKEGLGEALKSVYQFFALLAFMALLLGCIGVASAVHIYAKEKQEEVALLRCIGSSGWQAFNIYFIQVFCVGLLGSAIGSALGIAIQQVIPIVFTDFIPAQLQFSLSWEALLEGLLLGSLISVLFTILPLISVRFVPPLSTLRAEVKQVKVVSKTRMVAILLIVLFPVLAAAYQTQSIVTGVLFSIGLAVVLAGLYGIGALLLYLSRRFFPHHAAFTFRHALSNLFRPNNQTRVLVVAIGLGAFILATLNIIQNSLLNQVEFQGGKNQSNTILFDIQPKQKEGVLQLIKGTGLPMNQVVPMVTCRLAEVKGKSVETILNDSTDKRPEWAVSREYRVTYRDSLTKPETLLEGKLQRFEKGKKDSVFVTISEAMHETLEVNLGDSLVFDIQGVPIKTFISGIRKVEWSSDPPNFIFVFPSGVLENAPQIWVATTRIEDAVVSSKFQQQLVTQFSNVSLVDLRLILNTVNELFSKVAVAIRFLSMFSIITGMIVLAGTVSNSKFVRMKEYVLLRTIGARTKQISAITLIEYAYLGFFAAMAGLVLSLGAGWLLTFFFFKIQFSVNAVELLLVTLGVISLTVVIGWLNSRSVISTPPLQVLRKEA
jgi:putative ABC transport system permease protein